MKTKLLVAFSQKHLSRVIVSLIQELIQGDVDIKLVHTLRDCLDLASEFDIFLMDTDFSLQYNQDIIEKDESVEEFCHSPFPVFNALRKMVGKKIILYTIYREYIVRRKIQDMGLEPKIVLCLPTPVELVEYINALRS